MTPTTAAASECAGEADGRDAPPRLIFELDAR